MSDVNNDLVTVEHLNASILLLVKMVLDATGKHDLKVLEILSHRASTTEQTVEAMIGLVQILGQKIDRLEKQLEESHSSQLTETY